jgi:hypothetical protein
VERNEIMIGSIEKLRKKGRKRRNLWRKFKKVMLGLAMAMYERRRLFFVFF